MRFLLLTLSTLGALDPSAFAFILPSTQAPKSLKLASALDHVPVSIDHSSYTNLIEQPKDTVLFPPPLTKSERFSRAATFWLRGLPIVANYLALMNNLKFQEMIGRPLDEEDAQELWNELHDDGAKKIYEVIEELKGLYVKPAQIVSTREDLFPKQYTDLLSGFTDNLDPMPVSLAKAVVQQELLHETQSFDDVFIEFDEVPLGAASIAQVHRAVLTDKYGGREVAVKIQRPSIESKLMGDIANLKTISKIFRNVDSLPIDFYTIFSELEDQLGDEFDFEAEAAAMEQIYDSLITTKDGDATKMPITMPRPILVSRRVLVMDYLKGFPLSRAQEVMKKKRIKAESLQSKLLGRKLLKALTFAFGRNILETGLFHADAHPGNIFLLDNGDIGLIDFGQVKQISDADKETLAKLMIALDERDREGNPDDMEEIGTLALDLGLKVNEDADDKEAAAAFVIWLFDGAAQALPEGYETGEFSPNSPLKDLKAFPQDLVLVIRSTFLIKALSNRFGITWNLSKEWAPIARQILGTEGNTQEGRSSSTFTAAKIRLWNRIVRLNARFVPLKGLVKGRARSLLKNLLSPFQRRIASAIVRE